MIERFAWSLFHVAIWNELVVTVRDTSFPAISLTWLHRYYLKWTELDDDIIEFNKEMPLTENWDTTGISLPTPSD